MGAAEMNHHGQAYQRAMSYLATALPDVVSGAAGSSSRPVLVDSRGRPMPPARYEYSRKAAAQTGSMRQWRPRRLQSSQADRQRQTINSRIADLVGSDYHAAGVVNTFPITVIGAGLTPYPSIDAELLGLTDDQVGEIEAAMRRVYARWSPAAGIAGERFGQLQFLWERNLAQMGESLSLVHMKQRPGRRYRLCLRVIHPDRMKTPSDLQQSNIIDGVEVNDDGQPTFAWIKRVDPANQLSDKKENFYRISFTRGHRYQVLHDFYAEDPEQFRGRSPLAPIVKGFKDLSDFLDAELVANVVTAAFSLFIELQQGQNPWDMADNASYITDTTTNSTGRTDTTRYQRLDPGTIMYGNKGEKPHPISAKRPGATFEPFVRELKKAFAHAVNVPYPVLFHDVDGVSHAGFRSAMLEAWRVFSYRRQHIGQGPSQRVYNMLQEEAWLEGDLSLPAGVDFYQDMDTLCACEWFGAPKGDIEPYKAIKSDLLAHEGNTKTRERIILENGTGNPSAVIRQIEAEKKDAAARGIAPQQSQSAGDSEISSAGINAEVLADAVVDAMEERHDGI